MFVESTEMKKERQRKKNSFINPFRDNKHLHFSEHPFRTVVFNPGAVLPSKGIFGNAWRHCYYWQVAPLASSGQRPGCC